MACDNIRQAFKTTLIGDFVESLQEGGNNNIFVAIAKPTAWTDENAPDVPVDSIEAETNFWRECIALKRVKNSDISIVLPRYDWVSGVVYDRYTHVGDLFDDDTPKKFYVLVDGVNIFKCIDNADGVVSTVKPQETGTGIFETADGYRWKFIYKLSESDDKFLTSDVMPVFNVTTVTNSADPKQAQLDVQNAAIPGSIDFIDVIDPAQTFDYAIHGIDPGTHIIDAGTTGASTYRLAGSQVALVDGIYVGYSLKISDSDSVNYGEIREIISYDGSDKTVILSENFTDPNDVIGNNFELLPTLKISGDGSDANAEPTLSTTNYITDIDMINRGTGYTYADVLAFGGSTTATSAIFSAVISPAGGHGSAAVDELGAASVMISIELDREEDGLIEGNTDYRQFALISNPTIGGTVAGSEDEVVQSYFVYADTPINEFDGLTSGDKRLIGNIAGFSGQFHDYTASLGNARTGTLDIKNTSGTFVAGDTIVMGDADYTSSELTDVVIDRLIQEYNLDQKEVYRQTTRLAVGFVTSEFTPVTFTHDYVVRGTVSGAEGTIASWNLDFISGAGTTTETGTLDLVNISGGFSESDNLVQIDPNLSVSAIKASVNGISTGEMDYHSGKMLYMENIQALYRDDQQREQIRTVLEL